MPTSSPGATVHPLFLGLALAAPPADDALDAWYLAETGRGRLAVPWHLEQMQARPEDPDAVMGWLQGVAQDPGRSGPLVRQQVERWAEGVPDGPAVRAVRAVARMVEGWPDGAVHEALYPGDAGPWCAEAWALLEDLPPGSADATYTATWWRAEIGAACGREVADDRQALEVLGRDPDVAVARRTWYALRDVVDRADIPLLEATIEEEPWRLTAYAWLFGPEAFGRGVDAAREALRRAVPKLVAADRPATLHLAADLLEADGQVAQAAVVRRALAERDPGNVWNAERLAEVEVADDPRTWVDPAARLEALGRRPGDLAREDWLEARARALEAAGRSRQALRAYRRAARADGGVEAQLAFARQALASDRVDRAAMRAADRAVEGWLRAPAEGTVQLVDALWLRAQMRVASGDAEGAQADLALAVRLAPERDDLQVRLGLLRAGQGALVSARELLVRGLAGGRLGRGLQARGEAVLDWLVEETGTFAPDGVAGLVADARGAAVERPAAPPDLTVWIEGEARSLASVGGTVVVALWSADCAVCLRALPHLDLLARRHGERATFLAVSLDDRAELAEAHYRGPGRGGAFLPAWGGPEVGERLGVRSLPALVVLDGNGVVVDRISDHGQGPGWVEAAVRAALR